MKELMALIKKHGFLSLVKDFLNALPKWIKQILVVAIIIVVLTSFFPDAHRVVALKFITYGIILAIFVVYFENYIKNKKQSRIKQLENVINNLEGKLRRIKNSNMLLNIRRIIENLEKDEFENNFINSNSKEYIENELKNLQILINDSCDLDDKAMLEAAKKIANLNFE